MKRNFDITTLFAAMLLLTSEVSALAQNEAMPRLIVGININQLRPDYLYALQGRLHKDGIRRMLSEGVVIDNVTYNIDNPSSLSALATITTGSYPFLNGITGPQVFDVSTLQCRPIFNDKNYIGNGTNEYVSPKALRTSTLSDELMIATNYRSHIFSIAPDANEALLTAGHSANGAFWISNESGKWVTTTYFNDYPNCISKQNDSEQALFCNPKNLIWEYNYTESTNNNPLIPHIRERANGFRHKISKDDKIILTDFKTTPFVNDAITEMAKLLISKQRLGYSNVTDMIQLTYYVGSYQGNTPELSLDEIQDIYLKLDKQIESLLKFLDDEIGLNNVMIYLTGTGDTNTNVPEISHMKFGEFNVSRCTALLNSCLISIYGQGQWVDGYNDGQIYLNHQYIEKQGKRLSEVTQEAADFVSMMSGVDEVFTMQQLVYNDYSDRLTKQRNRYNKETGGDLIIKLEPGWNIRPDNHSTPLPQQRNNAYQGMAVIYAPSILKPKRISTPTEAIHIAPTVAKCLRIRAPSACSSIGLSL